MTDVFWMTRERDICRRIMIIGLREIRYESNHREFSAPFEVRCDRNYLLGKAEEARSEGARGWREEGGGSLE